MPNDAKLGLVVGVGLVIAVAVVFFRKDLPGQKAAIDSKPAAVAADTSSPPNEVAPSQSRVTPAQTTGLRRETTKGRAHLIVEGETLFTIAQRHYGDGARFIDIYKANSEVLKNPDKLPVGATLQIPD